MRDDEVKGMIKTDVALKLFKAALEEGFERGVASAQNQLDQLKTTYERYYNDLEQMYSKHFDELLAGHKQLVEMLKEARELNEKSTATTQRSIENTDASQAQVKALLQIIEDMRKPFEKKPAPKGNA